MEISPKESNDTFRDWNERQMDFPDELEGVCIQRLEKIISGGLDPSTRRDTRKYEYRVRATREVKGQTDRLLMDTGRFVTAKQADKVIGDFITAQVALDKHGKRHG